MRDLRVASAQISPRLGDVEANLERHLEWVGRARERAANLVVFPELSLTGYHLQDQVPEVALSLADTRLQRLLAASRKIDVVAGLVEESPDHRFYNTAVYLSHGRVLHAQRKLFLPTYGMFQEGREFAPGETLRAFDTPHGPVGLLVCEDLWHPTNAWLLAQQGAQILVGLANGPTRGARPHHGITSVGVWRNLLVVTAQFQTSYVVFVNRVGCEDGLTFGGGSMVVDPFGRILAELPPLEETLGAVDLDAEVLRRARTGYPLLRDADLELVAREVDRLRRLRFDLPEPEPEGNAEPPDRRGARAAPRRTRSAT